MLASAAIPILTASGVLRRTLHARWLQAEARRRSGEPDAEMLLRALLADAEANAMPEILHAAHTSLGLLFVTQGANDEAEAAFERAIAIIEGLRAPLPSEEFRTAFVANKLTPFF